MDSTTLSDDEEIYGRKRPKAAALPASKGQSPTWTGRGTFSSKVKHLED